MKNIKKINLLIFTLLLMSFVSVNVKATETGSSFSGGGGGGTGGQMPAGWVRNLDTLGYRVSLYYLPTGSTNPKDARNLKTVTYNAVGFSNVYEKKKIVNGIQTSDCTKPSTSNKTLHRTNSSGKINILKNNIVGWSNTINFCNRVDNKLVINHNNGTYSYSYNGYSNGFEGMAKEYEKYQNGGQEQANDLIEKLKTLYGIDISGVNKKITGDDGTVIDCADFGNLFLIIEPMQVFTNSTDSYYGTISELQTVANINQQMINYAKAPTTEFRSITTGKMVSFGILKGTNSVSGSLTADMKNAYGVGIIWIGDLLSQTCEKCYVDSADVTKGELSCKNTDKNNEVTISEKWNKVECSSLTETEKKVAKVNTQFGKFVKKVGDCNVYCTTSAKLSLPGNISNGKYPGDYFQWPTIGGTYPLTMAETKTCVSVSTTGNNCTFDYKTVFDDNGSSTGGNDTFSISLTGGTNKKINSEKLDRTKDAAYVSNTSASGQVFSITRKVEFKLPNNKNRFFNRITNEVSDSGTASSNIVDRSDGLDMGFVSTSIKDKTNVTYSLMLDNIKAGTSAKINDLLKDKVYSCTYKLNPNNTEPEYCPDDSVRAGQLLYRNGRTYDQAVKEDCYVTVCPEYTPHSGKIIALNGRTFSQAVQQDCTCDVEAAKDSGWDNLTIAEKCNNDTACINKCKVEELFCPNDSTYPGKKIDANGRTYAEAVQQDCYDNDCKENCVTTTLPSAANEIKVKKTECNGKLCGINYYCPQEDSTMDPTNCITQQLKVRGFSTGIEGYSQANAAGVLNTIFTSCKMTVCESGKRIIYRVIDLDNPFPGKYNRSYVSGFSNTNTGGRYPGANWNEIVLVKKKILNARGVKGYNLYNKTPLYTIKLTPDDIQKIREYNKNNEYSDFKLKCKTSGSTTKCISTFLRGDFSKILISGTCKHLSEGSSVDDFTKCYNEG